MTKILASNNVPSTSAPVRSLPVFWSVLALFGAGIVLFMTGCTTPDPPAQTAEPATPLPGAARPPTPTATDEGTPRIIVVAGDSFQGVIFSAAAAQQQRLDYLVPSDTPQFWTPTPDQIGTLEARLLPFLQTDERLRDGIGWQTVRPLNEALPDFTRQYLGYRAANGDEMIYASFFCNMPLRDLRDQWVEVLDGGNCFFQVRYNATTGTYDSVQVNGDA